MRPDRSATAGPLTSSAQPRLALQARFAAARQSRGTEVRVIPFPLRRCRFNPEPPPGSDATVRRAWHLLLRHVGQGVTLRESDRPAIAYAWQLVVRCRNGQPVRVAAARALTALRVPRAAQQRLLTPTEER
jgi:hypothetical protein